MDHHADAVSAAVLALILLLGSCTGDDGRREAEILDAERRGQRLTLMIGACNGEENRAEVEVRDHEVVVTVTTDAQADAGDCADSVEVTLPPGVEDRPIVDGSTGDQISVTFLN